MRARSLSGTGERLHRAASFRSPVSENGCLGGACMWLSYGNKTNAIARASTGSLIVLALRPARYNRNKHIFPASRWELYDPDEQRDTYTIHGGEVN